MQISEKMVRAANAELWKQLHDHVGDEDAMRAALEAALAAMWQDISTAPKDGRRILAYCDKIDPPIFQTQWHAWTGSWEGGGEWVDIWNNDPIETNDGPVWPSHWAPELPLPQLPRHKEG